MRNHRSPSKSSSSLKAVPSELLLEPWFLPFKATRVILSSLPPNYRRRLRDVFDDYGCLRCGRSDVVYASNGMCRQCLMLVVHRLRTCAMRRSKERTARRYGKEFMAKATQARKLLSDIRRDFGSIDRPARQSVKLRNPVLDAFDRYQE
jgi:ribosomal protein S14